MELSSILEHNLEKIHRKPTQEPTAKKHPTPRGRYRVKVSPTGNPRRSTVSPLRIKEPEQEHRGQHDGDHQNVSDGLPAAADGASFLGLVGRGGRVYLGCLAAFGLGGSRRFVEIGFPIQESAASRALGVSASRLTEGGDAIRDPIPRGVSEGIDGSVGVAVGAAGSAV